MSLFLIMNPGSRGGRSLGRHRRWISELEARRVAFRAVETEGPGHARKLARDCTEHDTVVAVGGDGTINEVLDGILLSGRRDVAMGILYAGTSPDFCRFHGIPTDPAKALDRLLERHMTPVDAVKIRYAGNGGQAIEGHFGCSCSVGMGAAVASFSNRIRPGLGDTIGTGVAVLKALFSQGPLDLQIDTDGKVMELTGVNHLVILKNPFIASGLKLDVDLHPADGRLWMVAATGRSPWGMLRLLPGFYSGQAVRATGVVTRTCGRVSVTGRVQAPLEFDGDPHGTLPLDVSILPGALNLVGGGVT